MEEKSKGVTQNLNLVHDVVAYCNRYGIPINHFIEIISDQKVVPMLRGKGTEYAVLDILKRHLSPRVWRVEKSNLNPQPGILDEDIVLINLRTSIRIVVESKNAVRGSFSLGTRLTNKPHFKVKCHKSRSFIGRETNDRYLDEEFDLLFTNPSNSIISPGKVFDLKSDPRLISFLTDFYRTTAPEALFAKANEDWMIAISREISVKGVIPRTPFVLMKDDPRWVRLTQLNSVLDRVLQIKVEKLVQKADNSL